MPEHDEYPKTLAHPDLPEGQTITVTRAAEEEVYRGSGWTSEDEAKAARAKAGKKNPAGGSGAAKES